jgi:uncharacterized protein
VRMLPEDQWGIGSRRAIGVGRCARLVRVAEDEVFVGLVLRNEFNRIVLECAPALGLPDWWLTAGAVFQTVWNVLDGRDPAAGINDYDLFYFDDVDLSWEAEDRVIRKAWVLFDDLDVRVEVRNEARVHLWYRQRFGRAAAPFTSSRDAIDHFASTTCFYAVSRHIEGDFEAYAPHGYVDLFAKRLRPNPVLAPREVYEQKAARWKAEWPDLEVLPWHDRPTT